MNKLLILFFAACVYNSSQCAAAAGAGADRKPQVTTVKKKKKKKAVRGHAIAPIPAAAQSVKNLPDWALTQAVDELDDQKVADVLLYNKIDLSVLKNLLEKNVPTLERNKKNDRRTINVIKEQLSAAIELHNLETETAPAAQAKENAKTENAAPAAVPATAPAPAQPHEKSLVEQLKDAVQKNDDKLGTSIIEQFTDADFDEFVRNEDLLSRTLQIIPFTEAIIAKAVLLNASVNQFKLIIEKLFTLNDDDLIIYTFFSTFKKIKTYSPRIINLLIALKEQGFNFESNRTVFIRNKDYNVKEADYMLNKLIINIRYPHIEDIQFLLNNGATLNGNPNLGLNLMVAAEYLQPEVVKFLLEAGADPYLKNADDKSFFDALQANEYLPEIKNVWDKFQAARKATIKQGIESEQSTKSNIPHELIGEINQYL